MCVRRWDTMDETHRTHREPQVHHHTQCTVPGMQVTHQAAGQGAGWPFMDLDCISLLAVIRETNGKDMGLGEGGVQVRLRFAPGRVGTGFSRMRGRRDRVMRILPVR